MSTPYCEEIIHFNLTTIEDRRKSSRNDSLCYLNTIEQWSSGFLGGYFTLTNKT